MKIFKYFFAFILLVVGVGFVILNATNVTFYYYFGMVRLPLSLLLVIGFAIGMFISGIYIGLRLLSVKIELSGTKKQLKTVKTEFDKLRVSGNPDIS